MIILRRLFCALLLISFLIGCSREEKVTAQGYIEGRYTYIATNVAGTLVKLNVSRGTRIAAGTPLFELQSQPESDAYRSSLENKRESLAAREAIAANLEYARLTYERYRVLVPKGAIQQSQLDNAKATYNATRAQFAQANANVAAADAAVAQAKWTLDQKMGVSPVAGIVFDVYYRLGEYTLANQAIMSLLAPADVKAVFYVSEKILGDLKLQQKVRVECDGCKKPYEGFITYISPTAEYTPPVIYSLDTNYKLVYRIEAAFRTQDAYQLHPGQPVQVQISLSEAATNND